MIRLLHHFGDCTLDVAARELCRAGKRVALSPPVFDCIAYLIEHRGRAVGRDELVAAVWGRAHVSDNLVGKILVKARRAVGDDGARQQMILTVPRFGFHWIAPVRVEDVGADDPAPDPVPSPASLPAENAAEVVPAPRPSLAPVDGRSRRRWPAVLAAFALLLAALAAAWWVRRPLVSAPASTPVRSAAARLAVLPVRVDGTAEDAWLRLGLMDLIAHRLRAGGVAVVPSDVVVRVVGDAPEAEAERMLGEMAGSEQVVVASARRHGSGWVLSAMLKDADGRAREIEVQAPDGVAVGREAADHVLRLLGREPAFVGERNLSLAEASQRVDAALLVNDFDAARRAIASASSEDRASPELQLRLSQIDYRLGASDAARERIEHLLPSLSAESMPALRARALTGLGAIALKQNRAAIALPPLDEAILLLDRLNEPESLGHALTGRGIAHAMRADYDASTRDFARARIAFELSGDAHAAARVDINEAATATMRERPADALPLLERAARRFERLDAPTDLANTLANEVDARLALLQPAAALAASERMMVSMERLRNPAERRSFLIARARALAACGRLVEARALLADLIRGADSEQEATLLGEARGLLASLDFDAGQAATAVVLARQAIPELDGAEFAQARAEAWRVLVQALAARGDHAIAIEEADRFGAWAAAMQRGGPAALARLARIEADPSTDDDRGEARREALRAGVPRDIAAVAIATVQARIAAGDLPGAADAAGELARWADGDFDCALAQVRLYHALGQHGAWAAALARARALAGERRIDADLLLAPEGASPPASRRDAVSH